MRSDYRSLLLRFRWAKSAEPPEWIVAVQDTRTGQLTYFANLQGLLQFLKAEFSNPAQQEAGDPSQEPHNMKDP
jgi:hypothetical protein